MSDLSKALDAAERAYAVDPSTTNWKSVEAARAAVERETTRLSALARIAADDAATKAEAEKQKLRDELAALSPTLNARAFFATLDAERKAVQAARLALFRTRIELDGRVSDYEEARERAAELHKLLGMSPPNHEHMSVLKAEAMLTFDAPDLPRQSLLVGPTALHECADVLGVGHGGGLDAQIRVRHDGNAIAMSAIRDKLTGSQLLADLLEADGKMQKTAAVAAAARAAAIASVKGVPGNTPESLHALADAAAHRAIAAHNPDNTTETN